MNFKRYLIGAALAVCGTANAATVFMPTNADVNFFNLTLQAGSVLAMFDDSDTGFTNPLAIPLPSKVVIGGPTISGDYTATNILSQSLTLTGNNWFILATNNNNSGWTRDVFSGCSATTGSCTVTFSDGTVLSVDSQVAAVPVPAAMWLFGSGLIGLAGIARRKQT
ncbi:MAG: VPLPA-CTERM sorting domain-containing protein [Pseudomonadota bacterium]